MAWISSAMAARALLRASGPEPEMRAQLVSGLRVWLPDTDIWTLRELAPGVAADFVTLVNAIDARRDRLVRRGKAKPYVFNAEARGAAG